jgi:tRNA(Ile)-lysidine synthase
MVFSCINTILQQIHLSGFTKPLLIGVSGGPDSLCLLDILHQSDYPLIIAHFNHKLRPEADSEASFVEKIAQAMEGVFVLGTADVAEFARENKLSIEEAARFLRYRFLFSQARLHGVAAVAVAHTADDQVETVVMHLLRGSGLSGLKGMSFVSLPNPWSQDIPLIRPMLSCWRAEILQYCQDHDLHPIQDESNRDITYSRNRLRHDLIPFLETYNPQVRKVLWRMAQTLAGDEEILGQMVAAVWDDCFIEQGSGYIALRRPVLLGQAKGMQRRLVRQGIDRLMPGLRDIDFDTIERAVHFITDPSHTANLSLTANVHLLLENDRIWIVLRDADLPDAAWPQIPIDMEMNLDVPGEVWLPKGWCLSAELIGRAELPPAYQDNQNTFQAWLSAEQLELPLRIRSRRNGDRYQPLGMPDKTVKLSDLMINVKLPRRVRSAWPVVCSKDAIIWIPGRPISHRVRISETTRKIVYLQLRR